MKLYSTVCGEGHAEQVIEKSRFISYVCCADSREDADAFIASIKKKNKDATHNVPALVLGDKFQIQWASDDGEPQGTSGAPIVQMLVQEGITNVAIVVTRYFGGIKLGTGGLVRAYTSSAKLALEAAGLCDVEELCFLQYKVDYSSFNKVQNHKYPCDVKISDIEYGENVVFNLTVVPEKKDEIKGIIENLTSGSAVLLTENIALDKVKK